MISEVRPGAQIGGYRVEAAIGRGGMGVVYRATDPALDRTVALKVLAPELAADADFRERFLRESRLAASLDHPHVLPVYQAGAHDGILYIAMRFVAGTDLETALEREGPFDPNRAVAIVAQVAAALDAAHALGLVHRDVKPGNVLLTAEEHVYLADFGLTKHKSSASGLTETGQLVGTLSYVAPEQIRGDPVDGRADLYSLGCLLYECLTGTPPYKRESDVAVLWAHVHDPAPSLAEARPGLPQRLDAVLATALAKTPSERQPTCGAFAEELRAALDSAGPTRRDRFHLPRPGRRTALLLVLAAVTALALSAVVRFASEPDEPNTAEILNEQVLAEVLPMNERMANALSEAASPAELGVPAGRLLEAVVRAQGAAGVVALPAEGEPARRLLQLALVDNYGYARHIQAASRRLDPYRLGALQALGSSTRAAYAALDGAVPGLQTPGAGTLAAAGELSRFVDAARPQPQPAPPPPPPPGGCAGGVCPPPASPPPPPPPPPPPAQRRMSAATSARRLAELRPPVLLERLVREVVSGRKQPVTATNELRDVVPALSALKAEVALAVPARRYGRATGLLRRWIEASVAEVLAVQSWLAALRTGDPSADEALEEHARLAAETRAARAVFERELARQRSLTRRRST